MESKFRIVGVVRNYFTVNTIYAFYIYKRVLWWWKKIDIEFISSAEAIAYINKHYEELN